MTEYSEASLFYRTNNPHGDDYQKGIECRECGAAVVDTKNHAAWHNKVEGKVSGRKSRAGGALRYAAIPEEAIEAACRAQYKYEQGRDTWVPYEEMPGDCIERYEQQARLVLEAAAPHIASAEWMEGYRAGELDGAYGANDHEPPGQRNPFRRPNL